MKMHVNLKGVVIKEGQEYSLKDKVLKIPRSDKSIIEGNLKPFLKEQTIYRGELKGFIDIDDNKKFYTYDDFFKMIEKRSAEKIDLFVEPVIENQNKNMDDVITDFIQGNLPTKEKRDLLESLESTSGSTYVKGEFEDSIVIDATKKQLQEANLAISEDLIQLINTEIQNDERNREPAENPGAYRSTRLNYGIAPESIKTEMDEFIEKYNTALNQIEPIDLKSDNAVTKIKDALKTATDFHTKFVAIHPFSNCNGKVARVLANLMLDKAGLPLAPINHWSSAYQYYTADYKKHGTGPLERVLLEAMVYDGIKIQKRPSLEEAQEKSVASNLDFMENKPLINDKKAFSPIEDIFEVQEEFEPDNIVPEPIELKLNKSKSTQEFKKEYQLQLQEEVDQQDHDVKKTILGMNG